MYYLLGHAFYHTLLIFQGSLSIYVPLIILRQINQLSIFVDTIAEDINIKLCQAPGKTIKRYFETANTVV